MDNKNMESVLETIRAAFPDKTLVDISEFEDENHQTYKYLYETNNEKLKQTEEELYSIRYQLEARERDLAELNKELMVQRSVNEKLNDTTMNIMEFVKKFTEQDIVVSNVKAMDLDGCEITANSDKRISLLCNVSDKPGIYGGKRPSWFTPLKNELNKENAARKSANNTKHVLLEKLLFWKEGFRQLEKGNVSPHELAVQFDEHRKKQIVELIQTEASNEEKYLKYFLLTPGMQKDFLKTLLGASEIGLDANVIIELLEQPEELFNKEIIELYVSEAHKGTEYNLKKELATELVRGDWYVSADINGKSQKLQLAPFELLEDLKNKLNNICSILSDMADEEVCAELAQTSSDIHKDAEAISDFVPDIDHQFVMEFDDSMLD